MGNTGANTFQGNTNVPNMKSFIKLLNFGDYVIEYVIDHGKISFLTNGVAAFNIFSFE